MSERLSISRQTQKTTITSSDMFLEPANLIPKWQPSARNAVLVQQVSNQVIRPLDPPISDIYTIFDWAIHAVIEVHCAVVSIKGLFCFEGSSPGAIRGLAGKPTWGAGMGATRGGHSIF